jgi:hypothetical protein
MPPGTTSSQLNGLACVQSGPCVAVGIYQPSAGLSAGFFATQFGGNWAPVTPLALPVGDTIASLNSVTCPAAGDCVAVGSVNTAQDGEMPMVVAEVNRRWQLPSVIRPPAKPTPRDGGDQLWSVACHRTGYCVAVGEYNVTADSAQLVRMPMMATESGGRWLPARGLNAPGDIARIPNAPGVGTLEYAGLKSVSCAPHGQCLAAGSYLATQAEWRSLAVNDLTGRWGAPQELIPGQGAASACTIAYCLIAASGAGPTSPGAAISYAGGRWSQVAAINPPADASRSAPPRRGYQLEISGVVCFAAGRCVAAGSYIDKLDRRVPMIAARS